MTRLPILASALLAALVLPVQALPIPSTADSPFIHVTRPGELPLEDTGDVTPLHLYILLHDDLFRSPGEGLEGFYAIYGHELPEAPSLEQVTNRIHEDYVAWWLGELGRSVLPGVPIRVTYRSSLPGITDLPHDDTGALPALAGALRTHAGRYGLPWLATYRNKFVLVTPTNLGAAIGGVAYNEGVEAVASLDSRYSVIAHEVGHMLGAAHDDAETRRTDWWWCHTNMHAAPADLVGNCYVYSEANRRRIQEHFHEGPGRPRPAPFVGGGVIVE
jgi:hypothetical protein